MKTKLYTALAVALLGISATSCSDGGYWDEASFGKATYAFPKPVYTVTMLEGQELPEAFEVVMTRNNSGAEATVPVQATFSDAALSGDATVTFAAGSNTSVYKIKVGSTIAGGSTFKVNLKLADEYYSQVDTIHNKCLFTLNTALEWRDAGTASVYSEWAGNEAPVSVPVQIASNYVGQGKMYRLVSPYYHLEPDYAEEGYSLQFLLNDDNTPKGFSPTIQEMGEYDSSIGDLAVGLWSNGGQGTSFTLDGNTYTMLMQVCCNYGESGWYLAGMMEQLEFTWTPPTAGN